MTHDQTEDAAAALRERAAVAAIGAPTAQELDGLVRRLPFPWTTRPGLSATLRDSALWAAAFDHPIYREGIKRAAKRGLPRASMPLAVIRTDDEQIGRLIIRLLESQNGRDAFFKEFRRGAPGHANVATILLDSLDPEALDAHVVQDSGGRWRLEFSGLESALANVDPSKATSVETLRVLAAFALKTPADAARLARLVLSTPALSNALTADLNAAEPARTQPPRRSDPGARGIAAASERASPKAPAPTRPTEVARAAAALSPAAPTEAVSPAPPPALMAPAETASRDASPEPAAPTEAAPPRAAPEPLPPPSIAAAEAALIEALRRDLQSYQRLRAELRRAADADLDAVEAATAVRAARERVEVRYRELCAAPALGACELPVSVPRELLAEGAVADAHMRELVALIASAAADTRARIDTARAELTAALLEVGLDVPKELKDPLTLEVVERVRARESPRIDVERALISLRRAPNSAVLAGLSPACRLDVLARALAEAPLVGVVLAEFAGDAAVRADAPDALVRDLLAALPDHLASEAELPTGLWDALFERAGDQLPRLLAAHRIHLLVSDVPDERLRAVELAHAIGRARVTPDDPFFAWLQERRLLELDAVARVDASAEFVLSGGGDVTVRILIEALVASGRPEDAVVVAVAAARAGAVAGRDIEPMVRGALLHSLVRAVADGARHDVLRAIAAHSAEFVTDEAGTLVLLYLEAVLDPDAVQSLLLQHDASASEVRTRYPTLVERWLLERVVPRTSRAELDATEAALAEARAAFFAWERDLAKKSCYTALPFATDYQRKMNAYLREQFALLAARGELRPFAEPAELLRHFGESLPAVHHTAERNMLEYLADQHDRLRTFARVARGISRDQSLAAVLAAPHRTLNEDLLAEALGTSGAIGALYAVACKETAP